MHVYRALLSASLLISSLAVVAPRAQAADADYWMAALSATEERRHADVVSALEDVDPKLRGARGDLLLAIALAALGRDAEALQRLPDDASTRDWPQAVRDDLTGWRKTWAARAGRCDLLPDPPGEGASLRVAAARCALGRGAPADALPLLAGLRRVDARELRAQALAESGDAAASSREVRRLWVEHPAHPHAERWKARLLEEDARFSPSAEERIERAKGFLGARQFETAAEELEGVRVRGRARERAALLHLRGTAQYRTRHQYPQAAVSLGRAAALKGATEASDAFHAARAYSRAGKNERAIRDYRRFAKRYPNSSRVAEALYLAAWLEARQGRHRAASRALLALTRHPALNRSPHIRDKVLWELGWQAHEGKRHKQAAEHLERYGNTARSGLERARGHYWAGVSRALLRQPDKAHALFTSAAHADPLGYYATLALERTRRLELGEIPAFPELATAGQFVRPETQLPDAARFYAELCLTHLAAKTLGRTRDLSSQERVALLVQTGEAEAAHRAAHALWPELQRSPPSQESRWLWRALYPTPFSAAVKRESEARGLAWTLIYAHMQVESRYDPSAVSGAGARGLLQLMPATARRVAETLGEQSSNRLLLNPAFNIRLGASYLGNLVAHYDGTFPPAMAAYNAGRANVDGWLERNPGPLDEWVERIPINQTRNYVRRVLTHWARYRYLEDPTSWQPPLPASLGGGNGGLNKSGSSKQKGEGDAELP